MQGLIVKGIGGFYYVETELGIVEAKGRGAFKKDGISLEVGDNVEIELLDVENKKAVINEILPRRNEFIRPPIVNVDCFIVTFAITKPEPNLPLVDKFLVMAEMNEVDVIIAINKCDLASDEEVQKIKSIYEGLYPVVLLSAKQNKGLDELNQLIKGKTVALTGPSGVGKSSIINRLIPHANMETGSISAKTERGKHTTRHVELFNTNAGGKVFDTPGFTSFEIMEADMDSLQQYYIDIEKFRGHCYYDNCRHIKEPQCMVRQAVKDGKINKLRYQSYIANLEEISKKKKY